MLPPPLKRHLLCLALALSVGPLAAQTSAVAIGASLRTTVEQDNLWDIAGQLAPVAGATRQQFMVAVLRRNPDAFVKGNIHRLRKGVPLVLPSQGDVQAEDRAVSVALVADHLKAMKAGTVLAPLTPRAAAAVLAVPVPASAPVPAPVPVKPEPVTPPPQPASAEVVVPPVPSSLAPSVPAAAASTVPAASSVPASPATTDTPAGTTTDSATRFLPWLLVLGGVAGGVILWRRRRAGFQPDLASAEFSPSLSAARTSSPRVFDISNAAAEMARSVETAQIVTQLVRTDAPPEVSSVVTAMDSTVQSGFKLDIARASLEVGRPEEARALLQAVLREGSGRQQAEAAEILARMG